MAAVVAATLLAAMVIAVATLGGPLAVLQTYVAHEGSPAYHFRDISRLMATPEGPDSHGQICDHTLFYNAYIQIRVKGDDIKYYDSNGLRSGCGNLYFNRNGQAHRTCAGNSSCGAWSFH